jgi:hypothetical protein
MSQPPWPHLFPVRPPLGIPAQARSVFLWGDVRVHSLTLHTAARVPAYCPPGRPFAHDLLRVVEVGLRLQRAEGCWSIEVVKPKSSGDLVGVCLTTGGNTLMRPSLALALRSSQAPGRR